jgi:putative transposase
MTLETSLSANRRYTVSEVCRVWRVAKSTYYTSWKERGVEPVVRRGPPGPCSDEQLAERIRVVLAASPFIGEGYRKAWARLRINGTRTSKKRGRRVMREHVLQAPSFPKRVRGSKAHDGRIGRDRPDEMWGKDATAACTRDEGAAFIFIAVDHCTSQCIGIHASASGSRMEALEPIRQGVTHFGEYPKDVAKGLALPHDHGSQYTSWDSGSELRFLGVRSTPSFIAEPECNGVAERFNRTLKEQLLCVNTFHTIEELRLTLHMFKHEYNQEWLVQKHGHVPPWHARQSLSQPLAIAVRNAHRFVQKTVGHYSCGWAASHCGSSSC